MQNEFIDKDELAAKEAKLSKKKEGKKQKAKSSPNSKAFVQILNGEFLSKDFMLNNLNFIFFIMAMLLIVIAKGYYGDQLTKDVAKSEKELNQATSEYFEARTKLEETTRRQVLVERLNGTGLKETVNPTKVIRTEK